MGRCTGLVASVALVLLSASVSLAGVDTEVPSSLKAQSTLDGGTDSWRIPLTEGAALSFTIAGKGGLTAIQFSLFDSSGDPVSVDVQYIKGGGKKVSLKKFPVTSTGTWRLEVSGTGSGDYSLTVKAVPRKTWSGTVPLAEASFASFPFAAPPGSTVTLSAKAVKGQAVAPAFDYLYGEDWSTDLSGVGKKTDISHVATVAGVQGTGDFDASLTSSLGAGDVDVKVTVKPPKAKPFKLDARGSARGRPGASGTLVGRVVGPGGMEIVVDDDSAIGGAGIIIPPGALADSMVISVASAPEPPPPSADDQAAGPAVDLLPSGTTFSVPVTVTLPFDLSRVPADVDPETDLRILVIEANGSSFETAPTAVNVDGGQVQTQVTGFSVCIPVVRRGQPRLGVSPGGDEFWMFGVSAHLQTTSGGASLGMGAHVEVGEASFFGDGTFQFSTDRRRFEFQNTPNGGGGYDSGLLAESAPEEVATTWSYGADGRTIDVQGDPNPVVLHVAADGSLMTTSGDDTQEPRVEMTILARKAKTAPTLASLAGAWNVTFLELQADGGASQGAAEIGLANATGTFTFDGKGGAKISATQRNATVNSGSGALSSRKESFSTAATYSVDGDGTVLLSIPPSQQGDSTTVLRFMPCRDGNLLLGTDDTYSSPDLQFFMVTRSGSRLTLDDAKGEWGGHTFGADPQATGLGGGGGSPFGLLATVRGGYLGATCTGKDVVVTENAREVRSDGLSPGGVSVGTDGGAFPATLAVSSDGKCSITAADGGVAGALSADGMFMVLVSPPATAGADYQAILLLRLPPSKP